MQRSVEGPVGGDELVKGLRTCSEQTGDDGHQYGKVRCHGTLNFPPWLLTVARGSYGLEGATNRRSCAADSDNYLCYTTLLCLLEPPPYIQNLDSWTPRLVTRFLSEAPVGPRNSLLRSCLSIGCMRTRRRIRKCRYFKGSYTR